MDAKVTASDGQVWDLEQISDDKWALLAPEDTDDDGDEIEWPTDEQYSKALGISVMFWDAGDHPSRSSAIMARCDEPQCPTP